MGSISKEAIQHEFIPLMFDLLMSHLQKGNKPEVLKAIKIMSDYNINIDMFKENLMSMVGETRASKYDKLETKVKTMLTKTYKTEHKSDVIQKKRKVQGESSPLGNRFNPDEEQDEEFESTEEDGNDSDTVVKGKTVDKSKKSQSKRAAKTKKGESSDKRDSSDAPSRGRGRGRGGARGAYRSRGRGRAKK